MCFMVFSNNILMILSHIAFNILLDLIDLILSMQKLQVFVLRLVIVNPYFSINQDF